MSLAEWLADGAEPSRLTPEDIRRRQNLLSVREEQSASRLEALLAEQVSLFDRGAALPSQVLRRVLSRRHKRLGAQVRELERELARVGKELAGLEIIQRLFRDGTPLAAPGDCTPLLRTLDEPGAQEEEFAEQLERSLRAGKVADPTGPLSDMGSDVMDLWGKLDRGEIASPEEARRRLQGGAQGR